MEAHQESSSRVPCFHAARKHLGNPIFTGEADWEGWLISRREVFNTPRVTINAACAPGGYVVAELVDRNNVVIEGFEKKNCIPFTGDSVRGEITWKTKEFPREYIDKDKKVKFYLKKADLYSYLPVDINQAIDDGRPD